VAEPGSSGDIQVVQRVAQLLTQFTVHRPQLSVAEAASLVGLNRTTVARYFGSMVSAGLLDRAQDESTGYVPGRLLLQLGSLAQGQRQVLGLAPPHMRRLAQETGLTVVLSLPGLDGPVVSLVSEAPNSPILITVRVGTVLDVDSAQGHLVLRFSDDEDLVRRYRSSVDDAGRSRMEAEVAATGTRGLAAANNYDVSVLSSPLFDEHGLAATIALVGTAVRLPAVAPREERALLGTALALTGDLGGTGVWKARVTEPTETVERAS